MYSGWTKYLALFGLLFCNYAYSNNLALGYGALGFGVPKAGSYQLYSLGEASDGDVLRADGSEARLYDLYDDKVVLLGFVYLSCSDVNGCPLTTFVISQLKMKIDKISNLRNNVRLLSLSFDPKRDTPKILKMYGERIDTDEKVWSLITTKNERLLEPILKKYSQPIQKIYHENGKETGEINHILRVFLIDKNKKIRNIYSNSFLHKDIVLSDIKTLLLEDNPNMEFNQTTKLKTNPSRNHRGKH